MAYQHKTAWGSSATPTKKLSFKDTFEAAPIATTENPYLKIKKIQPHNTGQIGENLLVPIYIGLNISGLQTISPEGDKKFIAGSEVSGGCYAINPKDSNLIIYIAEGFATAATIAEQTGMITLCAFNAGNLPKCATFVRSLPVYKDSKIVICADDDENGIRFAEKAALEIDGFVAYSKDKKDFNDLYCEGIDIKPLLEIHVKPQKKIEPERIYNDYTHLNDDFDEATIKDMLATISPDCIYQDWIEIGMALKAGGFGLSFWDDWSKGGAKYKKGDCYTHWQSFRGEGVSIGSLVYHAQLNGWKPVYQKREDAGVAVDVQAMLENAQKKIKSKPAPLPKLDTISFSGLIDDTADWIARNSVYSMPLLAKLNVIALLGAIFGRRYQSPIKTRTNIYIVGVAKTGGGKDSSRRFLTDLCDAAGLIKYLGDTAIRSDSGIVKSLMAQGSQLMMLDEFGLLLQALRDKKSGSHLKSVGKLFVQLYSSSSSIYKHGTYATDKMESMQIREPNLCLYGTTTEGAYVKALDKDAIESGELNRFIAVLDDSRPKPNHNAASIDMPEELVERWRQLLPDNSEIKNLAVGSNTSSFASAPKIIEWGETWQEMCDLLDYQDEQQGKECGELWVRYRENIIKIAMIFCLTEGKTKLELRHVEPAKKLVESSILYMKNLAANHMAENAWEGMQLEICAILAKNGASMKKSDLQRKMRKMKPREFADLLHGMHSQKVIEITREETGTRGRPNDIVELLQ